jgi:hypothetical protein
VGIAIKKCPAKEGNAEVIGLNCPHQYAEKRQLKRSLLIIADY